MKLYVRGGISTDIVTLEDISLAFINATPIAREMATGINTNKPVDVFRMNGDICAVAETIYTGEYIRIVEIASNGKVPRAGTLLFKNIMNRALDEGKGLSWRAIPEAESYYDAIGLVEYKLPGTKAYRIAPNSMNEALSKIN